MLTPGLNFPSPLLQLAGSTQEEIKAIHEKRKKADTFSKRSHVNKYVFFFPPLLMGGCSTPSKRTGSGTARIPLHCEVGTEPGPGWALRGQKPAQGVPGCSASPEPPKTSPGTQLPLPAAGPGRCFVWHFVCCVVGKGTRDVTCTSLLTPSFPFFFFFFISFFPIQKKG